MAQRVDVRLIDDLDGSTASSTVGFALDGRAYEIDLSEENRRALDDALAPFVEAARPAGRRRGRPARSASPAGRSSADRAQNEAVRAWARENGYDIAERGRLRSDVLAAYERRTAEPVVAEPAAAEPAAAEPAVAPESATTESSAAEPAAAPEPAAVSESAAAEPTEVAEPAEAPKKPRRAARRKPETDPFKAADATG